MCVRACVCVCVRVGVWFCLSWLDDESLVGEIQPGPHVSPVGQVDPGLMLPTPCGSLGRLYQTLLGSHGNRPPVSHSSRMSSSLPSSACMYTHTHVSSAYMYTHTCIICLHVYTHMYHLLVCTHPRARRHSVHEHTPEMRESRGVAAGFMAGHLASRSCVRARAHSRMLVNACVFAHVHTRTQGVPSPRRYFRRSSMDRTDTAHIVTRHNCVCMFVRVYVWGGSPARVCA